MSELATGGATRAGTPPPAAPPLPTETIAGVQTDIATVKQRISR